MNKAMLRSKMILNGDTYQTLADEMKINTATFSNKINDKANFSKLEMQYIKEKYNLAAKDFVEMFFTSEKTE